MKSYTGAAGLHLRLVTVRLFWSTMGSQPEPA